MEETEGKAREHERLESAHGKEPGGPAVAERHRRAATEGRQPSEPNRKDENKDDTDQECRQGHADERGRKQDVTDDAAPVQRGPHSERHAEQGGDQHGADAELERCGKALHEQLGDRNSESVGDAEVAGGRIAEKFSELENDAIGDSACEVEHLGSISRDPNRRRPCSPGQARPLAVVLRLFSGSQRAKSLYGLF